MILFRSLFVGLATCGLASAKSLWSSSPASNSTDDVLQQAYPLGNGRLGALPAGEPGSESINLNLDSLWTSGPFENKSYSGGNPAGDRSDSLPGIRDWIFQNGEGNVSDLLSPISSYGSYTPLADLTVSIDGVGDDYSDYVRRLDLASGVHSVEFITTSDGQRFNVTLFCSEPDDVCVYRVWSDAPLPAITVGLRNDFLSSDLVDIACDEGQVQMTGHLAQPGMQFTGIAQAVKGSDAVQCSDGGHLELPATAEATSVAIVVGAGTDYDQTKGNAAADYSFRGDDPTPAVQSNVAAAASRSAEELLSRHVADHKDLFNTFSLELPDPDNSTGIETAKLIADYDADSDQGNLFVESLLFEYGRYLLIASSRNNSLPANLQGRWAVEQEPAWGADYHANINLQMNYWAAPQVGLGSLQKPLWDFMENTWVPNGQRTAQLLYGAPNGSWVMHDEINIFGYTAMKDEAGWANYPVTGVWMALQIPAWLDYSGDTAWYRNQGYPLLKGAALFWLDQLQEDVHFNDGTLVVNPCNSPEQGPTTFGCANFQQLIWELFDRILAAWSVSGDQDESFKKQVADKLAKLDPGIHIGSWGQLQEWKLDLDEENNTHRHLSHLVGWHPGYSISGVHGHNKTVVDAVHTILSSRGTGKNGNTNAGWPKVWRAACWAGFNDTEHAFEELRLTIDENMAANGLSQYSGLSKPFQIDANFGYVAAVVAMLIRDLPQPYNADGDGEGPHTVILGPAIPPSWHGGSVSGMRLRGGGNVDFSWDENGVVQSATANERSDPLRMVNVKGAEVGSG